jgi:lipocalin
MRRACGRFGASRRPEPLRRPAEIAVGFRRYILVDITMTQENGHGHLQRRADDVRRPRGRANCAARPRRRQGTSVSLRLPFDQAQAVAMTLPSLLARALQSLTGSPDARYVFPLDRWFVELSRQHDGLLLTLATNEGFQVSFGIPAEACRGLD